MSGFFSAQRPIESPRDNHRTTIRRKQIPLYERLEAERNERKQGRSLSKPTVRLVKATPSPKQDDDSDDEDDHSDKENTPRQHPEQYQRPVSPEDSGEDESITGVLKPGSAASNQGWSVSDISSATNEADAYPGPTKVSTSSTYAVSTRPEWHRRSGSGGDYSLSSTLLNEGESGFYRKSLNESRVSDGTTLRETPTPHEQERSGFVVEDVSLTEHSLQTLATVEDVSPSESTVRIVSPSVKSDSTEHPLRSEPSQSSIVQRPDSSSDSDLPSVPRKSSRRTPSLNSLPSTVHVRQTSQTPAPRSQSSQESFGQSETNVQSSPNFVAYDSDSIRPRSRSHPLQATISIESIQSRLQYPTVIRPQSGHSLATSSSWASLQPHSSVDTLAPLHVPKRRLRHKQASSSLNAKAAGRAGSDSEMAEEEIDYQPYPRHAFSSHLSTIASESDPQSRTTSQHLSHFSIGSGVLTGDDASSIPLSPAWPPQRRESAQLEIGSQASPVMSQSSGEGPGDMTLGVFREESAKPQPLFQEPGPSFSGKSRKYEGPFPPMPPIPRSPESDEFHDTVTELPPAQLREKRSGYSVGRKSNSTPSQGHSREPSRVSTSDSNRWSQASNNIFPAWARNYYGRGVPLLSASQVSLGTYSTPRPGTAQQSGRNSEWTQRSITSRLGTGYSEAENTSPGSSRFLPSIFRPRTRKIKSQNSRSWRSKRSPRSGEDSMRADSMGIASDPLPEGDEDDEVLPSGQPKYGKLKDSSEQRRPLPRKYSKQKQWNDMSFPRPMTKDRLSDFDPHLAPSKRTTNRISAWTAPSFVESLDTLVRSRGNRQILLFAFGFICPLLWIVASFLPIPKQPVSAMDYEKSLGGSETNIQAAMVRHEVGDADKRFREEREWMKARWWRYLNRVMSVIGVLVIGAVIALAVVATS